MPELTSDELVELVDHRGMTAAAEASETPARLIRMDDSIFRSFLGVEDRKRCNSWASSTSARNTFGHISPDRAGCIKISL